MPPLPSPPLESKGKERRCPKASGCLQPALTHTPESTAPGASVQGTASGHLHTCPLKPPSSPMGVATPTLPKGPEAQEGGAWPGPQSWYRKGALPSPLLSHHLRRRWEHLPTWHEGVVQGWKQKGIIEKGEHVNGRYAELEGVQKPACAGSSWCLLVSRPRETALVAQTDIPVPGIFGDGFQCRSP